MYEDSFGTDWETIESRDEAITRAYALGVATRLGASHPGELERLNAQTATTYDRSFVELAYQKGRDEAAEATAEGISGVWETLVEEKTEIDPLDRADDDEWDDEVSAGSLPDALGLIDIDTLPDDSTERVRRPSMLDRDADGRPTAPQGERTVFGRAVSDVRRESGEPAGGDGDTDGDSGATDESPSDDTANDSASAPVREPSDDGSPADDRAPDGDTNADQSDDTASEGDRSE
ncbi:hypothetical protein D8Y22_17715 [Salinadaptatus halalkaliphilus]|uniref:Uncharacterized protein n=1 Tax=Salinadaptatus halalkaliphilus TaxID=2419781 RepID=A0A4S3TJD0_9EURY|nr:hypothetical protein [Salinadaptatus halalkaliphilus]THE63650.1 hypothetical protein D8Y22_17715 [Salinadaptatus halalkaliphilus]